MGGWVKRYGAVAGLSAALLLAFVLIIKLGGDLKAAKTYVLPGTYATSPGAPGGGEYLVFDSDGQFWHYRQFEMLDRGTYAAADREKQIYELNGEAGRDYSVVCTAEGVYFFRPDENQVGYFEKMSDVPTFINVES